MRPHTGAGAADCAARWPCVRSPAPRPGFWPRSASRSIRRAAQPNLPGSSRTSAGSDARASWEQTPWPSGEARVRWARNGGSNPPGVFLRVWAGAGGAQGAAGREARGLGVAVWGPGAVRPGGGGLLAAGVLAGGRAWPGRGAWLAGGVLASPCGIYGSQTYSLIPNARGGGPGCVVCPRAARDRGAGGRARRTARLAPAPARLPSAAAPVGPVAPARRAPATAPVGPVAPARRAPATAPVGPVAPARRAPATDPVGPVAPARRAPATAPVALPAAAPSRPRTRPPQPPAGLPRVRPPQARSLILC